MQMTFSRLVINRFSPIFVACLCAAQGACRVQTETLDPTAGAMLEGMTSGVVLPALDATVAESEVLVSAMDAWAASPLDDDELSAAREAWWGTMQAWHRVAPMAVGPLGERGKVISGEDGLVSVYSWPPGNGCRIDQETLNGAYQTAGWADSALVNVRGLDALEHLLFGAESHACASVVGIDSAWEAAGADGIRTSRANYAAVLAKDVRAKLTDQRTAMVAYGQELGAAGTSSVLFSSQKSAMNDVFAATFFVDTTLKNLKVEKPMGSRDCAQTLCASDAEHVASRRSAEAIEANMEGFLNFFTGGEGVGLDDVLSERGHGDISAEIVVLATRAKALAGAMDSPVHEAVVASDPTLDELQGILVELTDVLKRDVGTILALAIPAEAAGDND